MTNIDKKERMIDQEKHLYTINLLHSRQSRWKSATWKKLDKK